MHDANCQRWCAGRVYILLAGKELRMRTLRFILSLMVIGTAAVLAENKTQTEAQQDGLNGSVRSLTMIGQEIRFKLDPAGEWVIQSVPSGDVEYDNKGYRTKVGKLDGGNGEFQGQACEFVRDANGLVIERTMTQLPSQDIIEHDVYGPFGLVEATNFSSGKPTFLHTISYDQQGNVREDTTMEGDRKPIFRTLYRRNADGAWTERTMWLRGTLHSHETYDPDSDFQRYEEYDESGNVITTFTYRHDRFESYWSALNDGGLPVIDNLDNGDIKTWTCHNDKRICDGHIRHGVYLDAARHNPSMTEILSEPDERLLFRAYYEYQMDEHENWTSRKVWVQSGEQGERTLYETDSRTIIYWPK
jgi:hypothetical protein